MADKPLNVVECIQEGKSIKARMQCEYDDGTFISRDLLLNGLVVIKFKIVNCSNVFSTISMKLDKVCKSDNFLYAITLSCTVNRLHKFIRTDECVNVSWNELYNNTKHYSNQFDVHLSLDVMNVNVNLYEPLHDDTELVDFKLCGTDGSVHFHKAFLAGFSPVLKTMLCGQWKEVNTGSCEVPASKETLQQLKDYLYLQKLPESDDVDALAELASYYMNEDLKNRCAVKLLRKVDAANFAFYLEFARKYKLRYLYLGITACLHHKTISFENIETAFFNELSIKESVTDDVKDK